MSEMQLQPHKNSSNPDLENIQTNLHQNLCYSLRFFALTNIGPKTSEKGIKKHPSGKNLGVLKGKMAERGATDRC